MVIRLDSAPGNNPDFVKAIKHLFNREQMLKSIMIGRGVVANDQPIDPSSRFYFKGLKQRPYDPDKAKFHFQKSRLGSTVVPVVVSTAATNSVEMAVVLQYAARQIGMNLDVRRMPADGYWSQHWMKHPVGFGSINPRPSADVLLTSFFKSDAPWNESAWKNEKFDQLLVAARPCCSRAAAPGCATPKDASCSTRSPASGASTSATATTAWWRPRHARCARCRTRPATSATRASRRSSWRRSWSRSRPPGSTTST
jgi:hypothetical protein